MAICEWCNQEMTDDSIVHCNNNATVEFPDGKEMDTLVYSGVFRCYDCNVAPGYKHHPGCDNEECPKCLGQLISCGCLDEKCNT